MVFNKERITGFFDSLTGNKYKANHFEGLDKQQAEEIRRGENQHMIDSYISSYKTSLDLAKRDGHPLSDDWDEIGYGKMPHTRRELRKHLPK